MDDMLALVLTHPHAVIATKVVLTSFFWIAGIFGVLNFKVIVEEMVTARLPQPRLFAALTISCQLTGSFLVISNVAGLAWLGAGALAVFTLLCIPVAHPFWKMHDPEKTHSFHTALEHVSVVGGLMLAASISVIY